MMGSLLIHVAALAVITLLSLLLTFLLTRVRRSNRRTSHTRVAISPSVQLALLIAVYLIPAALDAAFLDLVFSHLWAALLLYGSFGALAVTWARFMLHGDRDVP